MSIRPKLPGVRIPAAVALIVVMAAGSAASAQPATRVTIIVDAFGQASDLRKDWGFAALVEHNGTRILFDTGNESELFSHNVETLGIDLRHLDFVVISHRHGDHTDGLRHLLSVNPGVTIYVPDDEYFGGPTPCAFFQRTVETLPPHMRYFDGHVPDPLPHGSPWKHANLQRVNGELLIAPGIRLVSNISRGPGFTETPELSLALDTPEGQLLLVGCSHPGIEQILESVEAAARPVRLVVGGFHWVATPDVEIARLARALRDEWKLPACTGTLHGRARLRRSERTLWPPLRLCRRGDSHRPRVTLSGSTASGGRPGRLPVITRRDSQLFI